MTVDDRIQATRDAFAVIGDLQNMFTEQEHEDNTCACEYLSRMKMHLIENL